MHPKFKKRVALISPVNGRTISIGSEEEIERTSLRDATLLLSIADICQSEIQTGGLANIWREDLTLPKFPCIGEEAGGPSDNAVLAPRTESLTEFLANTGRDLATRARSVSFDSPKHRIIEDDDDDSGEEGTRSPMSEKDSPSVRPCSPHTPLTIRHHRIPLRRNTLRLSTKARREATAKEGRWTPPSPSVTELVVCPSTPARYRKALQGPCRKGIPIKRILRKKFSWKNLPELEQFLIANREEYLRHSALNYTVQQKQYNNHLTERLLELATEHGYVFDEKEFSFVTVRDRIRCYYKSFVQSAKKRGVLMGYAARKAGLLTDDDLEDAMMTDCIVSP